MTVTIRPASDADLAAVLELNQTHLPAVGPLDAESLAHLHDLAVHHGVADDGGTVVGALIGLDGPGRDYGSHNYAWFSERFERFLYVDRIMIAESRHGRGLGRRLYEGFLATADGHRLLLAEVNVRPRNEGSLAFHDRMGFEALAERESPTGEVRVVMLARAIDGAAGDPPSTSTSTSSGELGRLEGDVATVERVLDRFHDLEPEERSRILDGIDGAVADDQA